jgi:hypothetical protein
MTFTNVFLLTVFIILASGFISGFVSGLQQTHNQPWRNQSRAATRIVTQRQNPYAVLFEHQHLTNEQRSHYQETSAPVISNVDNEVKEDDISKLFGEADYFMENAVDKKEESYAKGSEQEHSEPTKDMWDLLDEGLLGITKEVEETEMPRMEMEVLLELPLFDQGQTDINEVAEGLDSIPYEDSMAIMELENGPKDEFDFYQDMDIPPLTDEILSSTLDIEDFNLIAQYYGREAASMVDSTPAQAKMSNHEQIMFGRLIEYSNCGYGLKYKNHHVSVIINYEDAQHLISKPVLVRGKFANQETFVARRVTDPRNFQTLYSQNEQQELVAM